VNTQPPILLTGATGYVGGALLEELRGRSPEVRALARRPERHDFGAGVRPVRGDVLSGEGLAEALDGVGTAYYLVHSMGGANGTDFATADRQAARTFGRAARDAGVERVVYLGGLGPTGTEASEHLRSRHEVAEILTDLVAQLVYARAAMVIGRGSASFEMLRHLVHRLPAMITPRWIGTRSQPVALSDVVTALAELGTRADVPDEAQLGGAEVLTYRDMMRRFAQLIGRREPVMLPVPVLTPRLSSYWVSFVTPVDTGLVRPLVDGLRSEMVVTTPPPAGINDHPLGFDDAVRAAL